MLLLLCFFHPSDVYMLLVPFVHIIFALLFFDILVFSVFFVYSFMMSLLVVVLLMIVLVIVVIMNWHWHWHSEIFPLQFRSVHIIFFLLVPLHVLMLLLVVKVVQLPMVVSLSIEDSFIFFPGVHIFSSISVQAVLVLMFVLLVVLLVLILLLVTLVLVFFFVLVLILGVFEFVMVLMICCDSLLCGK